ncbi:hypothetical protein SFC65_24125 [Priestia filamentosa]|uniref:hypothetical protein n=1 Tax=Priestia filamentosa TaxID=1402861 RepID=UPI003981EC9B
MQNRSRDYYRHHRKRVIQNKKFIVTDIWGMNDDHPWLKKPGKLSKVGMSCSCKMCKYEKHYDILKPQYESKLKEMAEEIEEYFLGELD